MKRISASVATLVVSTFALSLEAIAAEATATTDNFSQFVQDFKAKALASGISEATYDREMATVEVRPVVIDRNANQPEFVRPIWSYLSSAVSERRVADGKANMAAKLSTLSPIATQYDVDASIIAAIWGLESAYGAIQGDHDVLSAVSTLAYQGRRQKYGQQQLLGALEIIDKGYASRSQLKGSWAGAMGQTQFIPTTYLSYAVDADADGRRDLWSNHSDVFASTANYLSRSGFDGGQPWGFEVTLPIDFDYSDASLGTKKPVALWASLGVMPIGKSFSERGADLNAEASVIVPAGAAGPAFVVFGNFRAILKYNNATSYALGVGMLSDVLAGTHQPLKKGWPTDDRPLTLSERKSLQQALADKGFNPGPVDGIVGAGTKRALRAWQQSVSLPADGYASAKLLDQLLDR
ncbi:MAG: lytic murein transglycosylase [Pseudomonadota bacterium]